MENNNEKIEKKFEPIKGRIIELMEMVDDKHIAPTVEIPIKPIEIKPSLFNRIKNYFKNLFKKKEVIIPETFEERAKRNILELDRDIVQNRIYEKNKYYENLNRARKESGGHTINGVPLFYDPIACDEHNETRDKSKAELKYFISADNEITHNILKKQERYQNRLDIYYNKKNH